MSNISDGLKVTDKRNYVKTFIGSSRFGLVRPDQSRIDKYGYWYFFFCV